MHQRKARHYQVAFELRIYIWSWKTKFSRLGLPILATSHASLELVELNAQGLEKNYDYLSFWPKGFHFNPMWQEGVFNPGYEPSREGTKFPHRYADTVFMAYHRRNEKPRPQSPQPTAHSEWVYEFVLPHEEMVLAIRSFIASIQSLGAQRCPYHILLNNCSTLIAQALELGGIIERKNSFGRFYCWTPAKIQNLCEALSKTESVKAIRHP